jgi:hypothetical protein
MGRRVLEILPVPPIALQLRTGIAMLSYADRFVFGITADYDTAPDIEALAAGIQEGVATLVEASRATRRKRVSPGRESVRAGDLDDQSNIPAKERHLKSS